MRRSKSSPSTTPSATAAKAQNTVGFGTMPPKYPITGRPALPMNSPLRRSTRSTAPAPAKPKRGAKAKAAAPAAPSPPPPVATLPGSSKTRASKRRATAKKPPTPGSESESESEELPLDELISLPAGEEGDLGGTLPSGTTNKGAALDEDDAGDGNDTPEDRARSVSQSPPHENEHTASPRPESERATSPRSENERTVSPRSENERTVSPRSEDERTLSPRSEDKRTVSPRPETERPETERSPPPHLIIPHIASN
ncbi:hypothetical protein DFH08DRAFT_979089 [Mycena albidolilacea]|uniref:Uncharacterized protein n=1 Tax=Mycena albidolilacea TaxID=1033008 RepID=A0AAD6YY51_9AGAR|nr:hypothetical protein DFH08DRAFT_979089 [Mycena albidolilacea]